jgi:hypothetical protein
VVQERFLAPCTLHFAAKQIFWECRQRSSCETFSESRHRCSTVFYGSRLKDIGGEWMLWQIAFEHYSRALTKEEDKLFAMSGIAAYFHSLTSDKYSAGLWQKGIERQLLWSAAHSQKHRRLPSPCISKRPSKHRARSWSWASLDSPVTPCHWMGDVFHRISIRVLATNIKLLSEDQPIGGVQYMAASRSNVDN